ncbi:DeoR/GlpR family DNA-binding transcription regulator [Cytophagaceae bacterium YF14B1]|uniref:DeoR/GlpR family DNA-binding transcription regulator n=1 Tax=Xanthocytophaga flava TaxID=3048013 RepID=A0AAE3QRF9_9BACT|nr:DeoR/GlpR family DNA-binding transcription regulator [Xanthocytophaga flavus]MDJ1483561.1 DeoR/GlpR family DNA-binding transcription regulator [Xanthocytophaga flavus]
MSFQNRKQTILRLLEEKEEVEVKEFAQLLNISEITIRRDLIQMAAEGLLHRTHGGAMRLSLVQNPVTFSNKTTTNAEQKDKICRVAAQFIQEGDIIFIDCGSTVFRLCPYIRHKKIKVITNSLPVVYELHGSSVSINLIGGELDVERQAIHGSIAEEHIKRYRANRAFIGVDGISPENGLSALSEKEASITLAMASHSAQVYLLCDATKLGQDKYLQFAGLDIIHTLITDADLKKVKPYQDQRLQVICVE